MSTKNTEQSPLVGLLVDRLVRRRVLNLGWIKFLRTPLGTAIAAWGGVLFLYSLPILDHPSLSYRFYFAMGLATAGAVFGDIVARFRTRRKVAPQHKRANQIGQEFQLNVRQCKRQYRFCVFVGLIGLSIICISLFGSISLSFFLQQQTAVKTLFDRNLLGQYLSMFAYVALILGCILRFATQSSWWFVLGPSILVVLYSASYWGKLPLLMGLLLVLVVRSCIHAAVPPSTRVKRSRWRAWTRLAALAGCLIAAFTILSWSMELRMMQFEAGYSPNVGVARRGLTDWLEERRTFVGSARSAIIIYSYATNPLLGLDYYVSRPSSLFFGELTFGYLGRMFHRLNLLEGDPADPYQVGSVEGVSVQLQTLLGYAFSDFSWLGVFGYSFLLIYCASVRYRRFLEKPAAYRIAPLAIYYLIILFSPWTCLMASTEYAFLFVLSLCMATFSTSTVTVSRLRHRAAVCDETSGLTG